LLRADGTVSAPPASGDAGPIEPNPALMAKRRWVMLAALCGAAAFVPRFFPADAAPALPAIAANENLTAAGTHARGATTISLVVRKGLWYPDGPGTYGVPIAAFGEAGKPLQIPGPFVRANAGSPIVVHLRNDLDGETLHIHGLSPQADGDAPITLHPGEVRTVMFERSTPGTYGYWAAEEHESLRSRIGRDAMLTGAIVIDDPRRPHPPDHTFVLGQWINVWSNKDNSPDFNYELDTINGRAWPATEELAYTRGDVVRWHVYNGSLGTHPMHLHGFPFNVDAVGDGVHVVSLKDAPPDREVTHRVAPGDSLDLHWTASRAGMWMYHCHVAGHIIKHAPLAAMVAGVASRKIKGINLIHLPEDSMGGIIVAVRVNPARGDTALVPPHHERTLALDVVKAPRPEGQKRPFGTFAYVVHQDGTTFGPTGQLGAPIVLTAGEPVAIAVTNHLDEATTIHWHGVPVQSSLDDGATGMTMTSFNGLPLCGKHTKASAFAAYSAPSIEPGKTFVAHFTPADPGTYMYHTHMDDLWQLMGGLAGPLIVLPKGAHFDPAVDHIVMMTTGTVHPLGDVVLMNGLEKPEPIVIHAGVPQRLRLINMTTFNDSLSVSLEGKSAEHWTPIAKDGLDLDPRLQKRVLATQRVTIGQTMDYRFVANAPGKLSLDAFDGGPVGSIPIEVVP
jgi:FtsP/CotA-like multicopper oxidase with cupredoxin domain